jgi:hypothetical protein
VTEAAAASYKALMRRIAALAACAALPFALSACAGAQPPATPSPHRVTPKVAALRDPQTLLTRIAIPPAAKPAPKLDSGLLAGSGGLSVGEHRLWRIGLPYRTVLRFFERQHPAGAVARSGMLVGLVHIFGRNRELDWSFRPIRPFLSSRMLQVTVLALSPSVTGVRVEVDDVWNVRPANERVPAGARTITIRRDRWQGDRRISRRLTEPAQVRRISRRLTQPAQVRQVVRWFDALPLFQLPRIAYHCPMIQYSPPTVITFLSARNRVLAKASIAGPGTGDPCSGGAIAVSVRGRPEPMLAGDFLARVLALAGVPSRGSLLEPRDLGD